MSDFKVGDYVRIDCELSYYHNKRGYVDLLDGKFCVLVGGEADGLMVHRDTIVKEPLNPEIGECYLESTDNGVVICVNLPTGKIYKDDQFLICSRVDAKEYTTPKAALNVIAEYRKNYIDVKIGHKYNSTSPVKKIYKDIVKTNIGQYISRSTIKPLNPPQEPLFKAGDRVFVSNHTRDSWVLKCDDNFVYGIDWYGNPVRASISLVTKVPESLEPYEMHLDVREDGTRIVRLKEGEKEYWYNDAEGFSTIADSTLYKSPEEATEAINRIRSTFVDVEPGDIVHLQTITHVYKDIALANGRPFWKGKMNSFKKVHKGLAEPSEIKPAFNIGDTVRVVKPEDYAGITGKLCGSSLEGYMVETIPCGGIFAEEIVKVEETKAEILHVDFDPHLEEMDSATEKRIVGPLKLKKGDKVRLNPLGIECYKYHLFINKDTILTYDGFYESSNPRFTFNKRNKTWHTNEEVEKYFVKVEDSVSSFVGERKMLRKLVYGAATVGVLTLVSYITPLGGYLGTGLSGISDSVRGWVPLETKLRHAERQIEKLDKEVINNKVALAKEKIEVEIATLKANREQELLAQDRDSIQKMRDGLGTVMLTRYGSEDRAREILAVKFNNFKSREVSIQHAKNILSKRSETLVAAEQKLNTMMDLQRQMKMDVQTLKSRLTLAQSGTLKNIPEFDDSKFGHAAQLLEEIEKDIMLKERLVDEPLTVEAIDTKEIESAIDNHFADK